MQAKDRILVVVITVCLIATSLVILPSNNGFDVIKVEAAGYSGNILYVGGTGPGNYSSIQAAIDDASPGDTIFVFNGTYYENVVVNKSINLVGEDKGKAIINGDGWATLYIVVNNTYVANFSITNGNGFGLYIESANNFIRNCNIHDTLYNGSSIEGNNNTIIGCYFCNSSDYGIAVYGENNIIDSCQIFNNSDGGILLWDAANNTFRNCKIFSNIGGGINTFYQAFSPYNVFINCSVYDNGYYGIHIPNAPHTVIDNCSIYNNAQGINTSLHSNYTKIINCVVYNNTWWGIFLAYGNNFTVRNCSILSNWIGIAIWPCDNSNITGCSISGNTYGIYIPSGESIGGWRYRYNIRIFNNYLQNHINALAYETISWNISKTQGTNIVGGHYLGGNYWSDYTGVDIDGDGIGDTNLPYNCSGNIVNGGDYAPLVARSTPWVYHTDAPIRAIAISRPNGKYVAVGSYKSSVYLFTREGKKIWKKPVPITSNGWGRSTGSVDISSDDPNVIAEGGPFVVAGGFDNKIYLFDRDGREVWSYDTGHDVYCVAISYFGDKIVCGAGNKIYYFLRNNAFPQWSYNVGARIHHIAMSWDGNYIAVGDCHGGTHLFKATGEKIWSYYSSPSDIARVDISLRGESLVAGTDDMSDSHGCKLFYFSSLKDGNPEWSATDGNPIWSFIKSENPGYDFWAVAISENGGWIAAGGSALNATYLFNKNSSTPKQIYSIGTAHAMDTAYAIDFSCNGDYLAVGTQRGRLLCFENNRNDPLLEYAAGKTIGVVSMSSNGHYVAAGSDNGNIYFFLLPIPVADFSFTPFNPTAADTIQFNDLSYDLDGTIVNWTWDFGDGSISYEQNPQHRYADDRIYTVTLTVTDNDGATASITKQIIVLPAVDTNPPVTQKEIGNPKHDAYITAFTPIYLNASDNETGVNYTYYEIWWDSDGDGIIDIQVKNVTVYDDDTNDLDSSVGNISIKFCFSEECLHELKWYSVDNAGNMEEAHTQIHYVDSSAPETIIEFGVPYYEAAEGNIWIASSTPVHFLAVDYPACASGIRATYYRVWYGGSWSRWTLYDENLSLEGEGKHYVEFHSVDNVGNIEEVHNQTFYVDNSAPRTIIEFHGPYYSDGIEEWISPDTLISLNATDYLVQKPTISDEKETGCGVNKTFYRVYKEGEKPPEKFSVYTGPFSVDEECTHIIEFYSVDNLGNTERVRTKVVKVDNSPPETNLTIGNPHVYKGNSPFVTSHTPFKFSSNDTGECAVGVENIWYRVWSIQTGWSDWMIYNPIISTTEGVPIIDGEGLHYVEYYSTDIVDNAENIHNLTCYADNAPPKSRAYCTYPRYIYIEAEDIGNGDMEPAVGGYRIHYRYRVGDENWTDWQVDRENENVRIQLSWPDNTAPINIPIYVEYYAVDALNNTENIHHDVFTMQRT